ncbi:MAG: hypothetical protein K9J16_07050, partial [Melioribacteraceae bacterium]|nr:hypothetical protein [Melioribacteraceae bacterium]
MFKKLLLLLLVAAFIPMLAQQRAIIDNYGNITFVKGSMNDALSTAKMKLPSRAQSSDLNFAAKGTIDTLGYDDYYVTPGVNFGMAANDYLYQYFEASTEMSLLAVGFLPLEWNGSFGNGNATAEVKLVNSNWTTQQWRDAGTVLLGYYPAAGNQPTETTAFASDPLASGEWVDLTEGELSEPFGDDLWSADGIGATLALTDEVWAWQDLTVLFTPEVVGGDVFGVSVKNVSGYDPETYGTSNWSAFSDEEAPEVGAKFYGGGRLSDDDYGWWVRGGYTWDFLVVVDITGDPPPTIENVTNLSGTTLETSDREVSATITDINPSGGDAGVAAASLFYT